jgi:Na+/H+-dicarboxylate symporter
LTNLVGNGVGALVIARWEGDLEAADLRERLERGPAMGQGPAAVGAPAD